jgi:SAM-dependent methyltransferase
VHFREDAAFIESALGEARRVVEEAAVDGRIRILDVGCGAGRLAYGLIGIDGPVERYLGLDVMAAPIEWCTRTITAANPTYTFATVDVRNERYNPTGHVAADDGVLPVADGSFDLVYAYSVLSHMVGDDVRSYLREFGRILPAGGQAIVTAFVEDDVPTESINPPDYGPMTWAGALHCVRFERGFFLSLVETAGLEVTALEHGGETDGQSRLRLRRR